MYALIANLTRAAETLQKQMENLSSQWLSSITSSKLFKKAAPTIQEYLQSVRAVENRHSSPTFAVTNQERRTSPYTFAHKV